MNPARILVIGNPLAGGGRGRSILQQVKDLASRDADRIFTFLETSYPGEAIALASRARTEKPERVIALGGDGTVHEVINGLLAPGLAEQTIPPLGIINCGSGGGLAQSLALPAALPEQLARALRSQPRSIDLGLVTCQGTREEPVSRYFISECQAGISGEIVRRTGLARKRAGGHNAYILTSVGQLLRYRATRMTIRRDGEQASTEDMLGMVIGNGGFTAGGMQLTPGARPDDGLLDVLRIGEMNRLVRFLTFARVFDGTHIRSPHYTLTRNRTVSIESDPPAWVEADGEVLGKTPCTIKVVPAGILLCY